MQRFLVFLLLIAFVNIVSMRAITIPDDLWNQIKQEVQTLQTQSDKLLKQNEELQKQNELLKEQLQIYSEREQRLTEVQKELQKQALDLQSSSEKLSSTVKNQQTLINILLAVSGTLLTVTVIQFIIP